MWNVQKKRSQLKVSITITAGALCSATLAFVFVGGCADTLSSEPDREAKQTAARPDYDQQVTELRKVVAANPSSTENQIRLAEVESKAADQHVAKAEQLRSQRKLHDALAELKIALDQVPAHPKALTMRVTIEKELQRAQDLVNQAGGALDQQDFKTAERLATEAAELDPTLASATEIRDRVRDTAVRSNLDAATKALEDRQWDTALAAAAKAREFDPFNTAAATIEKQAESRSAAMRMQESARAAIENNDYPAAIQLYQKAAGLWPENLELSMERDRAIRTTVDSTPTRTDAMGRSQNKSAPGTNDRISAVQPEREDPTKRQANFSQQRNRSVLDRYERHALAGEWELAWVAAIEAAAVALPNNPENNQNLNRAEEMIRQGISYRLGIVPMRTPAVPPEIALAACKSLAESIGQRKPGHVRLAEPVWPAPPIEESDLIRSASQPTSEPPAAALTNKLPNTDLALIIDIVATRSDSKQAASPATSNYLAGRKNVQNAAYADAQAKLREARKALEQARSDARLNEKTWDLPGRRALTSEQTFAERAATGYYGDKAKSAADRYIAAVKTLDQTPQWTQVDDWQQHQYPVDQITCNVDVRVRMRLVEVVTARVLWEDDQTIGRASHADTQIDGDAAHNVPAKAARLKDSRELIAEAVENALPALQAKGHEVLAHRPNQFRQQARESSGDVKTASNVRFLFDGGPACDQKNAMAALTEIFGPLASQSAIEACQRLALERLNIHVQAPDGAPAGSLAGAPATGPAPDRLAGEASRHTSVGSALPPGTIASSGRQPRGNVPTLNQPPNHPPAAAQWPGQTCEQLSPLPRADQRQDRPPTSAAHTTSDPRRRPGTPDPAAMKPAPAPPVPLPPPSDRAADMNLGRVYQGVVSRDDKRHQKEVMTIDGINIKLKDTGSRPVDADVEVTVGRTSTRKNDLPVGTRMLIRGASGRRYDLTIKAIDPKSETMWFTMQQTTLESLPR